MIYCFFFDISKHVLRNLTHTRLGITHCGRRIGIDRTEITGLVTGGVFSLVRNPIFTAMIFTAAGFAAMVPNIIAVVAAICLVVAIEFQVRYVEEPHLQRLHGHAYTDYATQVGRFIPLLGRMPEQVPR